MSRATLAFADLRRRFGALRVLRGVSGRVETGQVLEVTGGNGSGKSTLLRCLAGLLAPDAGQVELAVDGRSLAGLERRRMVGYASPELALYDELSALENLQFFARLRRVDPDRGRQLLERLGLPLNRPAGAFSSGMRQRLRWAWALLGRPPFLLLDEPYQNLDEPGRQQLGGLLEEHLETGLAVVANPIPLELPHVAQSLELGP